MASVAFEPVRCLTDDVAASLARLGLDAKNFGIGGLDDAAFQAIASLFWIKNPGHFHPISSGKVSESTAGAAAYDHVTFNRICRTNADKDFQYALSTNAGPSTGAVRWFDNIRDNVFFDGGDDQRKLLDAFLSIRLQTWKPETVFFFGTLKRMLNARTLHRTPGEVNATMPYVQALQRFDFPQQRAPREAQLNTFLRDVAEGVPLTVAATTFVAVQAPALHDGVDVFLVGLAACSISDDDFAAAMAAFSEYDITQAPFAIAMTAARKFAQAKQLLAATMPTNAAKKDAAAKLLGEGKTILDYFFATGAKYNLSKYLDPRQRELVTALRARMDVA